MAREHEIGRWRRVARVLEAEAEQLSSPEAKSAKYIELARLWSEQLDDLDQGASYFARAVEVDPSVAEDVTASLSRLVQNLIPKRPWLSCSTSCR